MIEVDQFSCQLGHDFHSLHPVRVDLSGGHAYNDLTPIPPVLAPAPFMMLVWDWRTYAKSEPGYCSGQDVVAQTIEQLGIWEPRETAVALIALANTPQEAPGIVVDIGAQLGWYALLAAHRGRRVVAIDADPECTRALQQTIDLYPPEAPGQIFALNGAYHSTRPRPLLPESHIRLLKIDVESEESTVIQALWSRIHDGRVDVIIMESSPVFIPNHYGSLAVQVINAGFRAYALPPKQTPPIAITRIADLEPYRLDNKQRKVASRLIEEVPQQDLVFVRKGAPGL